MSFTVGQPVTVRVNREGKTASHAGEYVRTKTDGSKGPWVVVKLADGKEMSVRPVNVAAAASPLD